MSAPVAAKNRSAASIDAEQLVLKSDQGHPVTVCYKITTLTGTLKKSGQDQKLTLPDKGETVIANFQEGKAIFSVNGKQLGDNEASVLGALIELNDAKTASDDDACYGSTDRKKVGEHWKVDPQAVARELAKKSMVTAPDNVDGSVTFVQVKDVAGAPAIRLALDVNVKGMTLPLPDMVKVDSSTVHVTGGIIVPVDPNGPGLAEQTKLEMVANLSINQNGQSVKITSTDSLFKEASTLPVK